MRSSPTAAARLALAALTMACLALAVTACNDDDSPAVPATGAIAIDASPEYLAAPWHVTGPFGYLEVGAGNTTLTGLRSGPYTVAWQDVAGYETPAGATLNVTSDSTVTFSCIYRELEEFPDSPDKVMQKFVEMYEAQDLSSFSKLMHPDFVTVLQSFTTGDFPDVGPTLDMTEERRIHERMFSGQDVTDPNGSLVPGISAITFQTFERQGTWAMSSPSDVIPNSVFAWFDVVVLFDRGQNYSTLKPQGQIKFYVTHRDSTVNGYTREYYQMRGQVDLTGGWKSAGETISWGSVKALFR